VEPFRGMMLWHGDDLTLKTLALNQDL